MIKTPASQAYTAEYMAAFDHTESFDSNTPEALERQPLQINADFVALFWREAQVPVEITFGVVDLGGKTYGECSDNTIRRYLREKGLAGPRDGAPLRVWLTSLACEVLDVTFAMVTSRTLDLPTYHPILVGEDFPLIAGASGSLTQ